MPFVHPNNTSVIFFMTIVIVILALFRWGVYASAVRAGLDPIPVSRNVAFLTFACLAGFVAVVASGLLVAYPTPGIPIVFAVIGVGAVGLVYSSTGAMLSSGLTVSGLILFQSFRLPLELVLHSWAEQGTIPWTMTWSGQNFDIVTGILALVTFRFAKSSLRLAWIVNGVGFVLLMNVMRVAVMSSPLPFAWPVLPQLQLVQHLPYALIAPVCVGGALVGHLLLFRKLAGLSKQHLSGSH